MWMLLEWFWRATFQGQQCEKGSDWSYMQGKEGIQLGEIEFKGLWKRQN